MPTYYLDASALVKNYVKEPGSTWVRQIIKEAQGSVITGTLSLPEVGAAFAILARTGRLTQRERQEAFDLFLSDVETHILLAEITLDVAKDAADLTQQHPLKGYDAVHLATALALAKVLRPAGLVLTLVTGDRQMIHAAQAEGLPVENPFDHAHLDAEER